VDLPDPILGMENGWLYVIVNLIEKGCARRGYKAVPPAGYPCVSQPQISLDKTKHALEWRFGSIDNLVRKHLQNASPLAITRASGVLDAPAYLGPRCGNPTRARNLSEDFVRKSL